MDSSTILTIIRDAAWQTIGVIIGIAFSFTTIIEGIYVILRRKQGRKRKMVIVSISLLCTAIFVVGISLIISFPYLKPQRPSPTNVSRPGVQEPLPTNASIPKPQKPSPTQASSPSVQKPSPTTVTSWHTVLNDPLTPANHRPEWDQDGTQCFFQKNFYVLKTQGPNYCNYGSPSTYNYSDIDYSLDIAIHQGNEAGLIFRLQQGNYYAFFITVSGNYECIRHAFANGGTDTSLVQGSSSAIHRGFDQWNTIEVVTNANVFTLLINGQEVMGAQDSVYTSGTIGVAAMTTQSESNDALLEVWARNLLLKTPPGE